MATKAEAPASQSSQLVVESTFQYTEGLMPKTLQDLAESVGTVARILRKGTHSVERTVDAVDVLATTTLSRYNDEAKKRLAI